MRTGIATPGVLLLLLSLTLGLGMGCVGFPIAPSHYSYFTPAAPDDAWTPKIAGWQRREQADTGDAPLGTPSAVAAGSAQQTASPSPLASAVSPSESIALMDSPSPQGDLRTEYFAFRAERKRRMARDVAEWIQLRAKDHYVSDGPIDHWATLEETLRGDGDDCDGLELLAFHALRDLGFDANEVYRAIVYRPSDGQHHMVTLWFEDRSDPWVIDPTGAMTRGMPHMSEMPAWVPIKVFSETMEYTVRPTSQVGSASALASNE